MNKNYHLLLLMLTICSLQACTQNTKNGASADTSHGINADIDNVEEDASNFLANAASGGMMEVQLGSTAEQNSKSLGVKNFGTMMVKDHGRVNEELKTLAASKNITLPSSVNEDHQKHINELTPLRGPEFDEKYMMMMVDDHREDIELFEKATTLNDSDISAFANKTLPVLKKHLTAAQKISDALNK